MNIPPETGVPSPIPPAAPNKSNNRTIIIIVVAVLAVCCLCGVVSVGGYAAYNYLVKPNIEATVPDAPEVPFPVLEFTPSIEDTATPEEPAAPEETPVVEDTPAPEPTPTIETVLPPSSDQPTYSDGTAIQGMGVSRAEMMEYFGADNAMTFGEPATIGQLEMVLGTHNWICVESNCAAITLAGPADDLVAIAVAAPTVPGDSAKTALSLVMLMNVATRFTDEGSDIPTQIMTDLLEAQSSGTNMEKKYQNNGYEFTATYDPSTNNIALAVARPRKQ